MLSKLLPWIVLASCFNSSEPSGSDLSFAIFRDPGVSSDTVTLCRVRVVNNGDHTWPGDRIRFEAQAMEGGTVVDRARGRFGLSLGPHQTLETLIGFAGVYEQFSVRPLVKDGGRPDERRPGKRSGAKHRAKKKKR